MEPIKEDETYFELHDAFMVYDPLGTGKISSKSLGNVMRSLGQSVTEAELYDIVDDIDMDGDGEVDFMEFYQMMMKRFEVVYKDETLRAAFRIFDRDEDGFITSAEMRTVMFNLGERCTEEEFNEMMKEIDADNDGKIGYEDFVHGVRS